MEEEGTIDWYAVKFGARDFAIFDTFGSEGDRLAHLAGKVGRALIANTPTLLSGMPTIERAEVLASRKRPLKRFSGSDPRTPTRSTAPRETGPHRLGQRLTTRDG